MNTPAYTANLKAFLDMIAISEAGADLLAASNDGYNVIVGSTAENPILFTNYADHPRRRVYIKRLGIWSTAAGRYQLLARYFDSYKAMLQLPDFSPASQDAIAIEQIKEQRAIPLIAVGNIEGAIKACSNIWASLPGANYGQGGNKLSMLLDTFTKQGGILT